MSDPSGSITGSDAEGLVTAQRVAEAAHLSEGRREKRIYRNFLSHLKSAGMVSGRVLEIGGRRNPVARHMPAEFDCVALDLSETGENVIVADITSCPQIPSESFDVVYSVDVFEHINRPWLAAAEITRLLRPGGIVYTSTLFSWRYHPCPIDYWRFTPDCLAFLFCDLDTIESAFDITERRRNIVGNGKYMLVPDAFGGWRENWRVRHVGRKPQQGDTLRA